VFEKEGLHIDSPNIFPVVLFGYILILADILLDISDS
jgi:hypothetical protein